MNAKRKTIQVRVKPEMKDMLDKAALKLSKKLGEPISCSDIVRFSIFFTVDWHRFSTAKEDLLKLFYRSQK